MRKTKWMAFALCLLLLTAPSAGASAAALELDEWGDSIYPKAEGALFDEGVCVLTNVLWGNRSDFVRINGWQINRGYWEGDYRITGWPPEGGDRVTLAPNDTGSFVSTGDALVYYGLDAAGAYGWVLRAPGDAVPLRLPLDETDTVFYADDTTIWYYTYSKTDKPAVGRVRTDGKNKKKLGTVSGQVVAMMPGQGVLLADFTNNRVRLWRDGHYETLYSPETTITGVTSCGRSVWIEQDNWFGPLAKGEVTFRLTGTIAAVAGTTDLFVLLSLPKADAEFFDILVFNEVYRAYAQVGRIARQEDLHIELQEDQFILWGPKESLVFDYPVSGMWLPYGYYDYASAENLLPDESWMQLLVGSWCAEPAVGSGYAERLVFTWDELYRLPAQAEDSPSNAVQALWYVSDGRLLVYEDRDAPRPLWLSGPFSVPQTEGPYSPMIRIDGVPYYQYSNDPAYFEDLEDYGISLESSAGSPKAEP